MRPRRRVMPQSCRFLGRKIYWFPVIICFVSEILSLTLKSNELKFLKHFQISRKTLVRWSLFFRNIFPKSPHWQSIRGFVSAKVKNDKLPLSLVDHFSKLKSTLEKCIVFMPQILVPGLKFGGKNQGLLAVRRGWTWRLLPRQFMTGNGVGSFQHTIMVWIGSQENHSMLRYEPSSDNFKSNHFLCH